MGNWMPMPVRSSFIRLICCLVSQMEEMSSKHSSLSGCLGIKVLLCFGGAEKYGGFFKILEMFEIRTLPGNQLT